MLGILKHPSFSQLKTEKTFCYIYIFYFIIDLRMCSAWWMWKHVKLSFVLFLTTWKVWRVNNRGAGTKNAGFFLQIKSGFFLWIHIIFSCVIFKRHTWPTRRDFFPQLIEYFCWFKQEEIDFWFCNYFFWKHHF